MTLLAFVLALAILITVHEWGHYRVAVALGVRVEQFSIGFGPALLKWHSQKHGQETEFVVSAIPLGGYVRMLDSAEFATDVDQRDMALNAKPLWARALIVLAGPFANLMLAIALSVGALWLGQNETKAVLAMPQVGSVAQTAGVKSGDWVLAAGTTQDEAQEIASMEDLRWWALRQNFSEQQSVLQIRSEGKDRAHWVVIPSFDAKELQGLDALGLAQALSAPVIGQVQAASPAENAGLQTGDRVLRVDGLPFNDASALRQYIRQSGAVTEPATQVWTIERHHQGVLTLEVTPSRVAFDSGYIGRVGVQIGALPEQTWVQYSLKDGLLRGVSHVFDMVELTVKGLVQMLTGQASAKNLTGPLGVAEYAGQAAQNGWSAYFSYLALISVSLFVLNLLPLPMLDGGHLMYYLLEAIRGRPLTSVTLNFLQRMGLSLIVALMVFTFFNDLERLGWLKLF